MKKQLGKIAAALGTAVVASSCTGQIPNSFRLEQQEQSFSSNEKVNTKIDLLWVVDNSASMDVSQEKLRSGFASFARKYLKPTWDIRVAVITTDTYMSDPRFQNYLNTVIPNTSGWTSPYIQGRLASWQNPSWSPNLVNTSTGAFDTGVKFGELVPVWGPGWATLVPGKHDGPIPALCSEILTYFKNGPTQCAIRDDQTVNTGVENCLNPGSGESSITQCVNTVQNDTVRSGRPIIETQPPSGTSGDDAWINDLIRDFTVNITTGSVGQGSERGFSSVLQLISENEVSETAFFRPGSLRGIIFVTDEEDQSMVNQTGAASTFTPWSDYKCDQAGLIAMNGSSAVTGTNGLCCSDSAKNCTYGKAGTTCSAKIIDGVEWKVSVCAREDLLMPVADMKTQLDQFFLSLDGSEATEANYFVVSIVPLTIQSVQRLQALRDLDDTHVGARRTVAVDRGDRYIELGNQVGNGSLALDIAEDDYSPILEAIGKSIISKKSTFSLGRAPTGEEDMVVLIKHADGSTTKVSRDKYVIEGKFLIINDLDFVLTLASTDEVVINYQPKTVF